ncbi:MAG: N-acyl homoserine lactonase family protein [Gammaproteobacteria bacterium]|jgi:glyoxylase-like metal-dependent hydrolase (beta-lactamase superfamily II)
MIIDKRLLSPLYRAAAAVLFVLLASCGSAGGPDSVDTVRIYIFDNGEINGLDTQLFNFEPGELAEVDFVNRSYLIVHPEGTLMFDAGAIPDDAFQESEDRPVVEGVIRADTPLLPQLAAAGYTPADIDYFALSHYHSDHTGNANAFARATWIVQRAERDFMFADQPEGIIATATFNLLESADTIVLDNADYDVFGDGSVVVMATPGHTPGHQVLAVQLRDYGPVVLAGDLYHYPEEIETDRVPTFEYDAQASRASRARVLRYLERTGARMWIEHDKVTHARLPLAPGHIE